MGFDFVNPFSICWHEGISSPSSSALGNPLIVARILSFLDVETIKISRGVCKIFALEATKHLSDRVSVHVVTRNKHKSLIELASFLSRHNIQHCLNLSLLPVPYPNCNCHREPYSVNVIPHPQELFRYLTLTGELVTELHLEICLWKEEDAALFLKILRHLPNLASLRINFKTYQIPGFLALDSDPTNLFTSVRSLSIGFHKSMHVSPDSLDGSSIHKLLNLFPLLNDLDTTNELYYLPIPTLEYFYHVLLDTRGENLHPLPLTGITLDLLNQSETEWNLFSRQLSFQFRKLHLFMGIYRLEQVERFIGRNSSTLTNLHLTDSCCGSYYNPDDSWSCFCLFAKLSLPALTTLRIDSYRKVDFKNGQDGLHTMDSYGLRQLFLNGSLAFETAFPNLTFLTIAFFMEFDESCWEYIFPDIDKDGTPLEISQLKRLSVTFAGDCDSPFVLRLNRIFPGLVSLCHTKLEFPPTPKFQWCRDKLTSCLDALAGGICCRCIPCCRLSCVLSSPPPTLAECCCESACECCCELLHQLSFCYGCQPRECKTPACYPDSGFYKVRKDPPLTLHGCEHVKNLGPEVMQLPFPASNFLRPFPCKFFEKKQLAWSESYDATIRPIWK